MISETMLSNAHATLPLPRLLPIGGEPHHRPLGAEPPCSDCDLNGLREFEA